MPQSEARGNRQKALRVHVALSTTAAVEQAAGIVEDVLRSQPRPSIGLATGGTMAPLFNALVGRYRQGLLSFSQARLFLLDEYIGLDAGHPESYLNVIRQSLADQVDLPKDALYAPDAQAADLQREARRYDHLVREADIDLQLLGIGGNGHIAFNEPGTPFDSATRVVTLSEATRRDNARFFCSSEAVPTMAISQGIGTILGSKRLLLMAHGAHKARPGRDALEGPVSPETPASAIQLHSDVDVVLDSPAASLLANV